MAACAAASNSAWRMECWSRLGRRERSRVSRARGRCAAAISQPRATAPVRRRIRHRRGLVRKRWRRGCDGSSARHRARGLEARWQRDSRRRVRMRRATPPAMSPVPCATQRSRIPARPRRRHGEVDPDLAELIGSRGFAGHAGRLRHAIVRAGAYIRGAVLWIAPRGRPYQGQPHPWRASQPRCRRQMRSPAASTVQSVDAQRARARQGGPRRPQHVLRAGRAAARQSDAFAAWRAGPQWPSVPMSQAGCRGTGTSARLPPTAAAALRHPMNDGVAGSGGSGR